MAPGPEVARQTPRRPVDFRVPGRHEGGGLLMVDEHKADPVLPPQALP